MLWVTGKRMDIHFHDMSDMKCLQLEIPQGDFARVVTLPESINTQGLSVKSENGLMWFILPLATA